MFLSKESELQAVDEYEVAGRYDKGPVVVMVGGRNGNLQPQSRAHHCTHQRLVEQRHFMPPLTFYRTVIFTGTGQAVLSVLIGVVYSVLISLPGRAFHLLSLISITAEGAASLPLVGGRRLVPPAVLQCNLA